MSLPNPDEMDYTRASEPLPLLVGRSSTAEMDYSRAGEPFPGFVNFASGGSTTPRRTLLGVGL